MSWSPTESEKEKVKTFIDKLTKEVRDFTREAGYEAKVVPVGSTAKDTFLAGDFDVDVFVVSRDYDKLFELAKYWKPNGHIKRGELLIWNFRENGFDVDLVFVSPEWEKFGTLRHTEFYRRALTERDREEIRKAKAFFKTYGVYGAEVGGITGIATEELVRKLGSLDDICKAFLEKEHGTWWVQDPTATRKRNLLASINKVRWEQIQEACSEYLKKRTFEYKPFTHEAFIDRHEGERIIWCERKLDKAVDFHTSMSVCEKAGRYAKGYEPDVKVSCDAYVGDGIWIAVGVEPPTLPGKKEVCIPESMTEAIEQFKRMHPDVEMYSKNGYKCALVPRKVTNLEEFVVNEILKRMDDRGYKCELRI